jgi:1-acyl-sn-glycerol-3-phosphate acyltransferase
MQTSPNDGADLDLRQPASIARAVRLLHPVVRRYFRAEVRGLDTIPSGPAVLVGNHSGGALPLADAFFLMDFVRRRGTEEPVYVLAHSVFTTLAAARTRLGRLGVVEATPENAAAALRRGAKVLVYPGGDHDNFRPFTERAKVRLGGRKGFVRLALAEGVPLVPIATAGAHDTLVVLWQGQALARRLRLPRLGMHSLPVTLCLPWGIAAGPFALLPYLPYPARVVIEVGEPIRLPRERSERAVNEAYQLIAARLGERVAALHAARRRPVAG